MILDRGAFTRAPLGSPIAASLMIKTCPMSTSSAAPSGNFRVSAQCIAAGQLWLPRGTSKVSDADKAHCLLNWKSLMGRTIKKNPALGENRTRVSRVKVENRIHCVAEDVSKKKWTVDVDLHFCQWWFSFFNSLPCSIVVDMQLLNR